MANLTATFGELAKESSMKSWKAKGHHRLVKVRSSSMPVNSGATSRGVGYVTVEKFLFGLTPRQMEMALGLKFEMLRQGARVYALTRLPERHEFEFKLHTGLPGGNVFDFSVLEDPKTRNDYWPPGTGLPQWDVKADIPLSLICQLVPNQAYPRYPRPR